MEITNEYYLLLSEQRLIVCSPFVGEQVKSDSWKMIDFILDLVIASQAEI